MRRVIIVLCWSGMSPCDIYLRDPDLFPHGQAIRRHLKEWATTGSFGPPRAHTGPNAQRRWAMANEHLDWLVGYLNKGKGLGEVTGATASRRSAWTSSSANTPARSRARPRWRRQGASPGVRFRIFRMSCCQKPDARWRVQVASFPEYRDLARETQPAFAKQGPYWISFSSRAREGRCFLCSRKSSARPRRQGGMRGALSVWWPLL